VAVELSVLVRGASGALFVLFGLSCGLLGARPGADRALARALAPSSRSASAARSSS